MSKYLYFGLTVLIIAFIIYLTYIAFSKFKKLKYISNTNDLESTSSNVNSYWGVISILAWFKSRKYIIYIAYGIILLMSILIIEIHIDNKRDKLFFDLRGKSSEFIW